MLGSLVAQDVGGNIFTDWVCNNPKSTAAIAIVGTAGIFGASSYFSCKKQQNIAHAPSQASALSEVAGGGKGFTWNIKMVGNAGKVDVQEYYKGKFDQYNRSVKSVFKSDINFERFAYPNKRESIFPFTNFKKRLFTKDEIDQLYIIPLWEENDKNVNSVVLKVPTICLIMEEANMAQYLGQVSGHYKNITENPDFEHRKESAAFFTSDVPEERSRINPQLLKLRNAKYYIADVYGNSLIAIEIFWGGNTMQTQALTSDHVTFNIKLSSVMHDQEYQALSWQFVPLVELIFSRFLQCNDALRGLEKEANPLGVPDITQGDCNKIISALKTMVGMN